MKPTFLESPQRYTRTARQHQSPADYASPLEVRRSPVYQAGHRIVNWTLALAVVFIIGLLATGN